MGDPPVVWLWVIHQWSGYGWSTSGLVMGDPPVVWLWVIHQWSGYGWSTSGLVMGDPPVVWLWVIHQWSGYGWSTSGLVMGDPPVVWLWVIHQWSGYGWSTSGLVMGHPPVVWLWVIHQWSGYGSSTSGLVMGDLQRLLIPCFVDCETGVKHHVKMCHWPRSWLTKIWWSSNLYLTILAAMIKYPKTQPIKWATKCNIPGWPWNLKWEKMLTAKIKRH